MVYSRVYLIAGEVISREKAEEEEYVYKEGFAISKYSTLIHNYPCCSSLNGKKYIKGRIVHIFHRIIVDSCGQPLRDGEERDSMDICGQYYRCDKCLGQTNGGSKRWFDVGKILDEIVEVEPEKVCSYCYDVDYVTGSKCTTCNHINHVNNRATTPPAYDLVKNPKFYLMLDDCLSCT